MALIKFVSKGDNNDWLTVEQDFDGLAYEWIIKNIDLGQNFGVYVGSVCEENEISRDDEKMRVATDVIIMELPAGAIIPFIPYIVAAVFAVAVVLLMPKIEDTFANQTASSGNNDLSNRSNKTRINGRFVDVTGEVYSVPDVLQPEWAKYVDGHEVRVGAYVFGRNTIDVKEMSDGESLISDRAGASAGIYRPYTSPNNSLPFEQIGDEIGEDIVGVYQSTDAVDQTLEAPELLIVSLSQDGGYVILLEGGVEASIYSAAIDTSEFPVGSLILFYGIALIGSGTLFNTTEPMRVSNNTTPFTLVYDVSSNPEFQNLTVGSVYYIDTHDIFPAEIHRYSGFDGDTYKITREKIDRLLFNVYAPSGMYKRASGDKQTASAAFEVGYYRLDDNGERLGSLQTASAEITGATDNSIGETIDIDLVAKTYIEWYIYRTTFENVDYNGTVVDVIKLKSVYGLFDLDDEHFGNITMVQTQRRQLLETTAIANPEINAVCTEMIYKYLGSGVFDTELTTNTQAMQSLIAKALDPKIGRLTVDDLDLDLLLLAQTDNETYYQTDSAGKCSYSFDDLNTSAQEVLFLIADAASVILWREGRLLKAWFERPQSVPEMVFTHRSKLIEQETWNRDFTIDYDGVEFTYINIETNSEETLTHPEDASNPKSINLNGFRGLEQATWRMLREYHKLINQRITVDFTASAEGRFAVPAKLISVVKGTRVGQTGGYIINVNILTVELSQEVEFTVGDDHFLVLKKRDGGTQTVSVTETSNPRIVEMDFSPTEAIYFGNDALKTEFSFGNEARLTGQLMLVQSVDASDAYSTKITAVNYDDVYYSGDTEQVLTSAFSDGFSDGFF